MRLTKGQIAAIVILVLGIGWIASGALFSNGKPETVTTGASAPGSDLAELTSVRVRTAVSEPLARDIVIQGRTEASRTVELRAEVAGRVESLPMEEGAPVNEGEVIVQIAVNDRAANLAQAEAELEQRRIQFEAARDLAKNSFSTKVRVAEAEAQFRQAEADVARFKLDLENTRIRAPFDGVLDTRAIDDGAFVNVGDRIGTVVDLDPMHVTGEVSEKNVGLLEPGMATKVRLTDGTELSGALSYVASVANPATKTFRIEVQVANTDGSLRAGLPAEISLPLLKVQAHKVASSVLSLAETGEVGVKVIRPDETVAFLPARILEDGPNGTWLGGLPEEMTLVVIGQDFVEPGQKVKAVPVE